MCVCPYMNPNTSCPYVYVTKIRYYIAYSRNFNCPVLQWWRKLAIIDFVARLRNWNSAHSMPDKHACWRKFWSYEGVFLRVPSSRIQGFFTLKDFAFAEGKSVNYTELRRTFRYCVFHVAQFICVSRGIPCAACFIDRYNGRAAT